MNPAFWKNKKILITGTSSGIGKALLEMLQPTEAVIYSVSRSGKTGRKNNVYHFALDITKSGDLNKLQKSLEKETDKLDFLVNNAGITAHGRFENTGISVFRKVFDINFFAAIELAQKTLKLLQKARGTVVGVSTVSGFYGIPGRAAYSASKSALHAAFESFAIEEREHGVKSVIICPPYTRTGLRTSGLDAAGKKLDEEQHKGKILEPEDVASRIIDVMEKGKTGVLAMDFSGHFVKWMRTLAPGLLQKILHRKLHRDFH